MKTLKEKLMILARNIIQVKSRTRKNIPIETSIKPGEIQISFEGENKFVKDEVGLSEEAMAEILRNLEKEVKGVWPF